MKRNLLNILVLFAVFVAPAVKPTSTYAITIVDPDAFPEGTNISNAFDGVTLSAVGSEVGVDPGIFAVRADTFGTEDPDQPFMASTGSLIFGTSTSHTFVEVGRLSLRADFAQPVDFISIDFIANDFEDYGELNVFTPDGTLLTTLVTPTIPTNQALTLSYSNPNIGFILAGGNDFSLDPFRPQSSVGLDNLQFNVVPEPSSLLLLGSGFAGLASWRWQVARKRTPASAL